MRYKTQIRKRLMYIFHINNQQNNLRPSWFYPTEGWTTDENEIKQALVDDGWNINGGEDAEWEEAVCKQYREDSHPAPVSLHDIGRPKLSNKEIKQ